MAKAANTVKDLIKAWDGLSNRSKQCIIARAVICGKIANIMGDFVFFGDLQKRLGLRLTTVESIMGFESQ